MEMWVLIVLIVTGTPRTVPIVAEFYSKERCEAAGKAIVDAIHSNNSFRSFSDRAGYICTPKGVPQS